MKKNNFYTSILFCLVINNLTPSVLSAQEAKESLPKKQKIQGFEDDIINEELSNMATWIEQKDHKIFAHLKNKDASYRTIFNKVRVKKMPVFLYTISTSGYANYFDQNKDAFIGKLFKDFYSITAPNWKSFFYKFSNPKKQVWKNALKEAFIEKPRKFSSYYDLFRNVNQIKSQEEKNNWSEFYQGIIREFFNDSFEEYQKSDFYNKISKKAGAYTTTRFEFEAEFAKFNKSIIAREAQKEVLIPSSNLQNILNSNMQKEFKIMFSLMELTSSKKYQLPAAFHAKLMQTFLAFFPGTNEVIQSWSQAKPDPEKLVLKVNLNDESNCKLFVFDCIDSLQSYDFFWDQLINLFPYLFKDNTLQDISHPIKKQKLSNYLMTLTDAYLKLNIFHCFLNYCNANKIRMLGLEEADPSAKGNIFLSLAKLQGKMPEIMSCLEHCREILGHNEKSYYSSRKDLKQLYDTKLNADFMPVLEGLFEQI